MLQEGGRMFILSNCSGLEKELSVLFLQRPKWFPGVQTQGGNCAGDGEISVKFQY